MENRSTQNDSNNIDSNDIIKYLNKSINYIKENIKFESRNESEKSSFVLSIEDFINQNYKYENNIYKNYYHLKDLIKIKLMNQFYPRNEIKKSYYYLELNDGKALFIERNKEDKKITISNETYQKGKIFVLDEDNKIVLILLIKTKDGKDYISLYCLDTINYPGQNTKKEFHYNIPVIKDYSCYILDINIKKEIIIHFCCEKEIHSYKFEFSSDDKKLDFYEKTKDRYTVKDEDELTSICSIKNIKMTDNILEKDIAYYTGLFLVSCKSNFKLFNFDEEGNIIFMSDIELEKENNEIFNGIIHIKKIRHLDNGKITIRLNNTNYNSCLIMKEKNKKEKKDV